MKKKTLLPVVTFRRCERGICIPSVGMQVCSKWIACSFSLCNVLWVPQNSRHSMFQCLWQHATFSGAFHCYLPSLTCLCNALLLISGKPTISFIGDWGVLLVPCCAAFYMQVHQRIAGSILSLDCLDYKHVARKLTLSMSTYLATSLQLPALGWSS